MGGVQGPEDADRALAWAWTSARPPPGPFPRVHLSVAQTSEGRSPARGSNHVYTERAGWAGGFLLWFPLPVAVKLQQKLGNFFFFFFFFRILR